MSMLSYVIRKVNTICIRLLNIQIPPHIEYNDIHMCFPNEFKPVKPEKTVISIRLDADVLKVLDTLSNDTDTVSYTHLDVYKRQRYNCCF